VSARCFLVCVCLLLLFANGASGARYQRTKDGKTLVWNNLRGVAQEVTWSGLRDVDGYATGEGTLMWYRLGEVVNIYTGKMVHGKFEGPVIREQGNTRLQTNFVNGEKAGDWSEPGSIETRAPSSTPTPMPRQQTPKPAATPPTEESQLLRTPIPSRSPARIPTPRPTPTATPLPTPAFVRSPMAAPTTIPLLTPRLTPPVLKSFASSSAPQPSAKASRLEEVAEGSSRDSLVLASPAPSLRNVLEEAPSVELSAALPPPAATPPAAESKDQLIAQFKKQTESVLGQVRDATGNFREINRIDAVQALPASVVASIVSLADLVRDFRSKMGYEVTFYECGAETATAEALTTLGEMTRDLTKKSAPEGRQKLLAFFRHYPAPTRDNQKLLWQYLESVLLSCDNAKKDAENHLQQAKSLDAAGKKNEALREYQEIYRIYPNPITADKIKLLEEQPR